MWLFLSLRRVYFVAIWRAFLAATRSQFAVETNCTRYLGHCAQQNLCGGISWFTFLLRLTELTRVKSESHGGVCASRRCTNDFSSVKSEQGALLGPVRWQPRCLAH